MNVGLTYDPMGRIIGYQRQSAGEAPTGNIAYSYDPMGRLLSCTEGLRQETYSYDSLGNRTTWKVNGIEKAAYSYDACNRLITMVQDGTAYSYTYDHRGNLTEEKKADNLIRQYVYDSANRMVIGKDLLSGAQSDYTYNALLMRVGNVSTYPGAETPSVRETAYVSDILSNTGNDLIAYREDGGNTRSVYGGTYERLSYTTAAGQTYEMPDLWGSPLYAADPEGNAAWRTGYDIWGNAGVVTSPEADTALRFTSYTYDPVIGKYFAGQRFYDSAQGRMLSPDPIKRGLNPYPYCDNDPVNHNDPTGEIPSIIAGGVLGFFFGGASGFVGSTLSQVTDGEKFSWSRAWGAAANGAVVGAAKGALVGSGVGIPAVFATDFVAGASGNALEQFITKGRINAGESLLSGITNAVSERLYGTGEIAGFKDALIRGAKVGGAVSGINNIAEALGLRGAEVPVSAGRDPKSLCGSPDSFVLAEGLENGRGYHGDSGNSGRPRSGGFSLGGLLKDALIGAIVGGLGSAGFYGASKAVDALRESFAGRRRESNTPVTLYRGDRATVIPDDVFNNGFKPKGTHNDPLLHTSSNRSAGNFVSTSSNKEIAVEFAGKNGYVYVINTDNYININKIYGSMAKYPEQMEFSIPGGVRPSEVVGAYKKQGGVILGEFIPNSNYGGKR